MVMGKRVQGRGDERVWEVGSSSVGRIHLRDMESKRNG